MREILDTSAHDAEDTDMLMPNVPSSLQSLTTCSGNERIKMVSNVPYAMDMDICQTIMKHERDKLKDGDNQRHKFRPASVNNLLK